MTREILALLAGRLALTGAWQVGSGSISILPPVEGRSDYFVDKPTDSSPAWAGVFVEEFDHGRVGVGNGNVVARWVRDDVRVHAAVVESDVDDNLIVVYLSSETYMLFEPDIKVYESLVEQAVDADTFSRMRFFVHGQHNHEAPDTSGMTILNREWYEWQMDRMVEVTLEALHTRQEARLEWADTHFHFGLRDKRDPVIFDDGVHILRAWPTQGDVDVPIVSLVNWAVHPECTLGFDAQVPEEDCLALDEDPDCTGKGRFFTGDFPGVLHQEMSKLYGGGDTVYVNAGIGALMQPWGPVWEITEEHPLGDGTTLPDGAVDLPRNFRRAFLIGSELARAVYGAPSAGEVQDTGIEWKETYAYGRLSNIIFQLALNTRDFLPGGSPEKPLVIGYAPRDLMVCPEGVEPSDEECHSDEYQSFRDPDFLTLPRRVGTHARLIVSYAKLGHMQFLSIPGEMAPELVRGLPRDFDEPEGVDKYFREPELHVTGQDYTMPGVLRTMLNCTDVTPCFFMGLTNDEMGYMLPLSDWQLKCRGSAEDCQRDHDRGAMTFPNAMDGASCKQLLDEFSVEFPRLNGTFGEDTALNVLSTCKYGQLEYESGQHYEETMSGSWDATDAYFQTVSQLLDVPLVGRFRDE